METKPFNPKSEFDNAFQRGMEAAQPRMITEDGVPFIVIPDQTKVEDLEHLLPVPRRKRAKLQFDEPESFIRYVNQNKGAETRIFASNRCAFEAILDYHGHGPVQQPSWCEHRASLGLSLSQEWQVWNSRDRQWFGQKDFAEFLEDHQIDVINPPGAELLDIALTIQADTSIEFLSGMRLQDGSCNLRYKTTVGAKAGAAGELEIPAALTIQIPIYRGASVRQIDAKLRYSIADGKARFQYLIWQKERLLDESFKAVVSTIADATQIVPFMGHYAS